MTQPTLHFVACADAQGGHRMAYWQWGDAQADHVVLCVHGLTRQGRDFDELARAILAKADGKVRVVCPDVVGRGHSDWLKDPQAYGVPTYAGDMLALLAQLNAEHAIGTLDYVGTSMGGLIGMAIAGSPKLPMPAPIRRLVLNDVGPSINGAAIERIAAYVGKIGRYSTLEEAADAMWALSTTFGEHTPEQWRELTRHLLVPASQRSADGTSKVDAPAAEDGAFVLHYDPAIAVPIRAITPELAAQAEVGMWALYDAITATTLLVRGAVSDLLLHETAVAMTERGPRARLVEFENVGHAPTLVVPAQSSVVASFLLD
ncbi:alpha/beta hydrolase [Variovorax sp. J22R133]|uniref:alpha/beta fold hydrolase n=1 Tax=Variovorax brevis TaxID=3053503 RepID=UPI0025775307|nr:alpha/beta hydrolase [Variovorax sp. J22R133]MDM0112508.1 alpha/beta hydrolase [Variovorax sp. J22R133]